MNVDTLDDIEPRSLSVLREQILANAHAIYCLRYDCRVPALKLITVSAGSNWHPRVFAKVVFYPRDATTFQPSAGKSAGEVLVAASDDTDHRALEELYRRSKDELREMEAEFQFEGRER